MQRLSVVVPCERPDGSSGRTSCLSVTSPLTRFPIHFSRHNGVLALGMEVKRLFSDSCGVGVIMLSVDILPCASSCCLI